MSEALEEERRIAGYSNADQKRLEELARRSLLAEQMRQLAHGLRTPLSVVDLISETLQLELSEDADKSERIAQVLSASGRISAALTESLRESAFPVLPPSVVDAWAVASRLTRRRGGLVESEGGAMDGLCRVHVAPDAFEAAIIHALSLVGEGDCAPVLSAEACDGWVGLRITAERTSGEGPAPERFDRRLMRQVIERVVCDAGGRSHHGTRSIELRFPAAGLSDVS